MLNLFLFGNPRLERDRKPIEFDTRKALALFAYLAVTRTSHRRDTLATLLYPDFDQTHARAALRRTLSSLNTALNDDILDIDRETLALNPQTDLCIDVVEFERALAECKSHKHSASDICADCMPALTRAAELYHDDFLSGFTLRDSPNFDDWQFFTAENLRREFAGVLEKLVRYHSEQQAYAPAIEYARRWLALDSLHEPAHRQLMQLYTWSDQRAAALRQYQECARILEKELGVAPLAETTRLYEAIKAQRRIPTLTISPLPPSPSAPQRFPLVGRANELEKIKQVYANIRADGHLIVIEGEAGIGKTRLAEEFVKSAREHNAIVLTGRAYEGETNLAHGIFVEALRALSERDDWRVKIPAAFIGEVARLAPEIGNGETPPPLDNAGARGRFFQAVSQTIFAITMGRHPSPLDGESRTPHRGAVPGVLLLDDLQWADGASLDLLTYIVRRLRGQPLCIVAMWRTEPVALIERLRQMVAHAQHAHAATTITLARLNSVAVMQLVASTIGDSPVIAQRIGERLQRETEGLPFFIVEYLNALDTGNIELTDWSLPGGVRDLLRARLASASETGKQLLNAAAVIGRSFDFDILREASGRTEEETIKTLEELTAQGLIKEFAAENLRYDFAHEKLRELAYAETSAARRRLLHRRTADALANQARARRDGNILASQVARHYQLAGENLKAADYFKLAGDHARALYANAEALTHYRNAFELGYPDIAGLYQAIGDLQTLLGDYAGALTSYATAATLCEPATLAIIEHKRGNVHHRRGEYDLAESHFAIAQNTFVDQTPDAARANLLADWSLTAHAAGQNERAQEIAGRALALAESARDLRALAQTRNILGILARNRADLPHARYQLEHACALAENLNDPSVHIAALNNLALVCHANGEIDRAIQLSELALTLCVSMGDQHHQAALHNNLADLFHAAGKNTEAMEHLKQAVAIFADIGADGETTQPEIWKLVEW